MDVLQYYELKQKYENVMMDKKRKIKKNKELNLKEKRVLIKRIIGKCVNCGKPGGTIFEEKDNMLKAVCGSKTPCDLNISLKRKLYDNMRELTLANEKKIENLKLRIIMTKLDFLFGYNISKEDTVDKFNTLKHELSSIVEKHLVDNKKYSDIISGIHRDPLLQDANADLALEIDELKKLYSEYLVDQKPVYLTAIVEKYITTIRPLVDKINKLNYGYYAIELDSDVKDTTFEGVDDMETKHYLVARPYRLDQMEQERK